MDLRTSPESRELLTSHLGVLREYAKRATLGPGALSVAEQRDKAKRMGKLMALGDTFWLTKKDLVVMLFKGLLTDRTYCGCPTCRKYGRA